MVKILLRNKQERLEVGSSKVGGFCVNRKRMDKKATIGAGMTWVVATFIILLAIVLFVYSSYAIAKQRGLLGVSLVDLESEDTYIESQQTLLALMNTPVEGKSIRQRISDGDIKKSSLETLVKDLPGGNWSLYIDDFKVNEPIIEDYFETRAAVVFVGSKKVKLFQSGIG